MHLSSPSNNRNRVYKLHVLLMLLSHNSVISRNSYSFMDRGVTADFLSSYYVGAV